MLRTQLELEPWEIEVAFHTDNLGLDPDEARTFTILRWLYHGDLRPLQAAIVEGRKIDGAVFVFLVDMISGDTRRLGRPPPYCLRAVRPLHRGRPKKPELDARRIIAALAYERQTGKSDEKFERVARAIGTSDRTVRREVTASRKAQNKRAK